MFMCVSVWEGVVSVYFDCSVKKHLMKHRTEVKMDTKAK